MKVLSNNFFEEAKVHSKPEIIHSVKYTPNPNVKCNAHRPRSVISDPDDKIMRLNTTLPAGRKNHV